MFTYSCNLALKNIFKNTMNTISQNSTLYNSCYSNKIKKAMTEKDNQNVVIKINSVFIDNKTLYNSNPYL